MAGIGVVTVKMAERTYVGEVVFGAVTVLVGREGTVKMAERTYLVEVVFVAVRVLVGHDRSCP
jgi:hypothetical protein